MNTNHEPLDQVGAMLVTNEANDAEFDDLDINLLSDSEETLDNQPGSVSKTVTPIHHTVLELVLRPCIYNEKQACNIVHMLNTPACLLLRILSYFKITDWSK